MNAVNLIPADSRGRRGLPVSRPTLALMGGLLVVLLAAIFYVTQVNTVTARRSELARVSAGATAWNAAAARYAAVVAAAQHHAQELADVRQLAGSRFPWSQLLSQIGGLMPAAAALSSMQATTTPSTTASAPPTPTVQLVGCAASQSTVAQTMVQLHEVNGVTAVGLSSSTDSASGSTSAAAPSGSGAGSGGCPFPVQFQISLTFAPSLTTAATATAGAGATATAGAGAAATSGAATTASTPITTTGGSTLSAAAPAPTGSPQ